MAALLVLGFHAGAAAGTRPDSENMGKLLAYTLNCSCVAGEQDWILGIYDAVFTDAYGEAYAEALKTPLQNALKDGWDHNMSLCKRICGLPVTHELQQTLARADGGAVDGSGVLAVLGPAPADGSGIVVVPAGSAGSSAETAASVQTSAPAPANTAAAAALPDEEAGVPGPVLPNYCAWRTFAKGCLPEDRAVDAELYEEREQVTPASAPAGGAAATGSGGEGDAVNRSIADTGEPIPTYCGLRPFAIGCRQEDEVHSVAIPFPTQDANEAVPAAPVEAADVPAQASAAAEPEVDEAPVNRVLAAQEEELSSTVVSVGTVDGLYESAGTGDNWSSAICRTSPSRPECRRVGAE